MFAVLALELRLEESRQVGCLEWFESSVPQWTAPGVAGAARALGVSLVVGALRAQFVAAVQQNGILVGQVQCDEADRTNGRNFHPSREIIFFPMDEEKPDLSKAAVPKSQRLCRADFASSANPPGKHVRGKQVCILGPEDELLWMDVFVGNIELLRTRLRDQLPKAATTFFLGSTKLYDWDFVPPGCTLCAVLSGAEVVCCITEGGSELVQVRAGETVGAFRKARKCTTRPSIVTLATRAPKSWCCRKPT
jgi:hypothetical protein